MWKLLFRKVVRVESVGCAVAANVMLTARHAMIIFKAGYEPALVLGLRSKQLIRIGAIFDLD